MSDGNSSYPILNPVVYLNYLQPSDASDYEAARDLILVTLGALLWDILSSLPSDCKLIRTSKFSPVLFAYFTSRTFALAVVLVSTLSQTGPVQSCSVVVLILCIFWIFASGSSSYLFLKRVHAVWFEYRLVCHAFTALWIAGLGVSTLLLPGLLHNYYQIANTKHCTNGEINGYVSAAFIMPLLFDALVYFAITYKILVSHRAPRPRGWKAFYCLKTGALPRLSQAILKGGQGYYSIASSVNITRINLASPNISPVWELAFSVPALALTCAMACRVFRDLRLEATEEVDVGIVTTIRFAERERANVHLSKNADPGSAEVGLTQVSSGIA